MKKSILVISPHPDDETLGAGGFLLKNKYDSNSINWLNITNMKEEYGYASEDVMRRNKEILKVRERYGFDNFCNLELEPAKLDKYSSNDIISEVSKFIKEVEPNIIVLPYRYDIHTDHQIVFDWIYSCTKIFRFPFIKMIMVMEIQSETDFAPYDNGFVPNYFVDITTVMDEKINIMKEYKSEIKKHPFPRSEEGIRALGVTRGAVSGVKYAESFKILKLIE